MLRVKSLLRDRMRRVTMRVIGEGPYLISNAARAGWGEMVYEGRRLYWFPYKDAYYRLHERQQIASACLVLSTLGLVLATTLPLLRRKNRQVRQ